MMAIKSIKEVVNDAKGQITTLSLAEAHAKAEAGDALFVDIRDVRELKRDGKIPGAFHAPRGMLEFWFAPDSPYHKPELADAKTLILYCASAWRSALATKALQDMGAENVVDFEGGFTAWRDAGLPVDKPT